MNSLVESLIKSFLLEEKSQKIGIFGGSFKPPTKGHLQVVLESLNSSPDLDKFYILIGSGIRDNITQKQSSQIWNIYKKYLPSKVELIEVGSPLSWIKDYLRDNPNYDVTVFIGSREGNEEDIKDFNERSKFIKKYSSNLSIKNIITPGEISGTKARNALQIGKDEFFNYLPPNLPEKEKEEIYNILLPSIQEIYDPEKKTSNTIGGWLHENATYSNHIDYKKQIKDLTSYMLKKGMNIQPLPTVVFKHNNQSNAQDFFGKTAYYNPNTMTIVLYTEGRHPKDIVRSYAHEMIHHIQNIENRLGNISTTNTQEDDHLNNLEQEAYLNGNITFRNWTDSLNENTNLELVQQFRQEIGPSQCSIYGKRDNCGPAALDFISWAESKGIKGLKRIEGYFKADIPVSSKKDFTPEMKQEFLNDGGNWDNNKERFKWIFNSKYAEQWKYIPHYWVEDTNGKIYDPTGQQQFIDTGYAKDLSPNRYTLTDNLTQKENIAPNHNSKAAPFGSGYKKINESFYLDIPKFSQPKTIQQYLIENINEISLSKENAVDIDGDLTGGEFTVGDITYIYKIKALSNPYKDGEKFFNISFTPKKNITSIPQGGKENYIKILSTMYKILVDFIEVYNPGYIGLSSLDNDGYKNYHTVYNKLTTNNLNLIPGYFRKDSSLQFDSPQGKGRFIVLKKKDNLNEKKNKDPFGLNQFVRELVSEGKYDKISNSISSNIFNMWKKSFIEGKPSSRYEAEYEDEFFTIAIDANISFIPNSGEFKVDGGADEEDPYIQVRFEIDPDFLPKMWSDVSMALKDVIRHEVEHLTQGGEYEVSGKGIEDDMFIRKMIDADLLPKSAYFKLEKEIDANLQGMYFRAKKEKRPFRDVIDDYLDLQPITSEEKEEILNLWRKRLPALNLPKF